MSNNLNWDFFSMNFNKNKAEAFELLSTLCFYRFFSINGGLPRQKNHPMLETDIFKIRETCSIPTNLGNFTICDEVGFQSKFFESGKLESNGLTQLLKSLKISKNKGKLQGINEIKSKHPNLKHIIFFSNVEMPDSEPYKLLVKYLEKNGIIFHGFFKSNFEEFLLNKKENLDLKENYFNSDSSVRRTEIEVEKIKHELLQAEPVFNYVYESIKKDILNKNNKIFFINGEKLSGKTTYAKQIETIFNEKILYIPFLFLKNNIYDFLNESFICKKKYENVKYVVIDDYLDFQEESFSNFIKKYKKNGFKIILLSQEKNFLYSFKSMCKINMPLIPKSFFKNKINHKINKEILSPSELCNFIQDQSNEIVDNILPIKNNHLINAIKKGNIEHYFEERLELLDFFIEKNILKNKEDKIVFFNENIEKKYYFKIIENLYEEGNLIENVKLKFKNNTVFHDSLLYFISLQEQTPQKNIFLDIFYGLNSDFNLFKEKVFLIIPKEEFLEFISICPSILHEDFILSAILSRDDFYKEDYILIHELYYHEPKKHITKTQERYFAKVFPFTNEKEQEIILMLVSLKYEQEVTFSNIYFFYYLQNNYYINNKLLYSIIKKQIDVNDDLFVNYIIKNCDWELFEIFLKKIFFDIQHSYNDLSYITKNNKEKEIKIEKIYDYFFNLDKYKTLSILKNVKDLLIENNLYNTTLLKKNNPYYYGFEKFYQKIDKNKIEVKNSPNEIISKAYYFNENNDVIEIIKILNNLFYHFYSGSYQGILGEQTFFYALKTVLSNIDLEKKDILVFEDYLKKCLLVNNKFKDYLNFYGILFSDIIEDKKLKEELLFHCLLLNVYITIRFDNKITKTLSEFKTYSNIVKKSLESLNDYDSSKNLLKKLLKVGRENGFIDKKNNCAFVSEHLILRIFLFFNFYDDKGNKLFQEDFLQKRVYFSVKKAFFIDNLQNKYQLEIFLRGVESLNNYYFLKIKKDIINKYNFNIKDKNKLLFLIKNSYQTNLYKKNKNNNPLSLYLDIYFENIININPSIEEFAEILIILQKREPFSSLYTNFFLKTFNTLNFNKEELIVVFLNILIEKETNNNTDILSLFCFVSDNMFILEKDHLVLKNYNLMIKYLGEKTFYKEGYHLKEYDVTKKIVTHLSKKIKKFENILDHYF